MAEEGFASVEQCEVPFARDSSVFHLFGTVIAASAVFDLVAIAQPAIRPDWSDLMQSMGRVSRAIAASKWSDLPLGIAALVTDLGVTLQGRELTNLLDNTITNAQRYGAAVAFARTAAELVRLARE